MHGRMYGFSTYFGNYNDEKIIQLHYAHQWSLVSDDRFVRVVLL